MFFWKAFRFLKYSNLFTLKICDMKELSNLEDMGVKNQFVNYASGLVFKDKSNE